MKNNAINNLINWKANYNAPLFYSKILNDFRTAKHYESNYNSDYIKIYFKRLLIALNF